ncbi:hypothetical protein PsorP6_008337 [Peronosclerospora sorghi]|uniref:Uncharacterized protein n=1 Tax=Peronosclerospora sorghi TaxID=230839 RepID=A0ACC0W7F4_9STRA|nr:hypothetical protein PsorP6_008337 [Peronosclerospora sorghi]
MAPVAQGREIAYGQESTRNQCPVFRVITTVQQLHRDVSDTKVLLMEPERACEGSDRKVFFKLSAQLNAALSKQQYKSIARKKTHAYALEYFHSCDDLVAEKWMAAKKRDEQSHTPVGFQSSYKTLSHVAPCHHRRQSYLLNSRLAFVPPKPNEFVRTARNSFS